MNDRSDFEARLTTLFAAYADRAPLDTDPVVLAAGAANSRAQDRWSFLMPRRAWVLVGVALALLALGAALAVGSYLLRPRTIPGGGGLMIVAQLGVPTSHFAVPTAMNVFTLDVTTGERMPIVDWPLAPDPSSFYGPVPLADWSPDRRHVLLVDPDGSVRGIVDVTDHHLTGPGALSAVKFANSDAQTTWSPGSDRIAALVFHDQTHAAEDLLIVDLGGREIARLSLPGGGSVVNPSWSPDGSSILLDYSGHLIILPTDGAAARVLPEIVDINGGAAVWSPDGSMIAYRKPYGIAVTTLADGRETMVTNGNDLQLTWSPDGRQIAFVRLEEPGGLSHGIYTALIDGTHLTQLTDGYDDLPNWSPDGRSLVFSRPYGPSYYPSTWVVPSGGGEPRLLVKNASADW